MRHALLYVLSQVSVLSFFFSPTAKGRPVALNAPTCFATAPGMDRTCVSFAGAQRGFFRKRKREQLPKKLGLGLYPTNKERKGEERRGRKRAGKRQATPGIG